MATRSDLQLGRRFVHAFNGIAIASAYLLLFSHRQLVSLLGTFACVVYVLDRIRIHYPELGERLPSIRDFFFRAEEQFRESAMVPYVIAILLTILTFPKPVAVIAIYTLGIADPAAAIVGIRWGRHRSPSGKSFEGSGAFFLASFACALGVLSVTTDTSLTPRLEASLLIGLSAAVFEMLPLRIDDNLTIPLFVGFVGWATCLLFGIPV